jgi:addiction module RelE/StbE family toxin
VEVFFSKHFEKRFARLPLSIQKKALARIQLFQLRPFDKNLRNHSLIGKWSGYRSINITGDYRAIYLPVNDAQVKFYTIDTHSNLYK